MSKKTQKSLIKPFKKIDKAIITNVNMFLLGQEHLRGIFWNVADVEYKPITQTLRLGITVADNKLGTALEKMRKCSKDMCDYLYDGGFLNAKPKIEFYFYKPKTDINVILERLENEGNT